MLDFSELFDKNNSEQLVKVTMRIHSLSNNLNIYYDGIPVVYICFKSGKIKILELLEKDIEELKKKKITLNQYESCIFYEEE